MIEAKLAHLVCYDVSASLQDIHPNSLLQTPSYDEDSSSCKKLQEIFLCFPIDIEFGA
jgi:hypothetical protein